MIYLLHFTLFGLLSFVSGGEWLTAGGQFCIDKCRYHNDQYFFYWCHVSDMRKEYSDHNSWGSWGYEENSPETHLKWDYCVPSVLDNSYDEAFDEKPGENDGGLEWHDPNAPEEDTSLAVDENTIHAKGPMTVLYKLTRCSGKRSNNKQIFEKKK